MVHLSDPPELQVRYPVDELRLKMAGGPDSLEMFLSAMREFARDTDFMTFFSGREQMYGRLVADYKSELNIEFVGAMEGYFGARQNSYNIVLTPLFMPGGYGPRVEVAEGVFDTYFIGGTHGLRSDSLPGFPAGLMADPARVRPFFCQLPDQ